MLGDRTWHSEAQKCVPGFRETLRHTGSCRHLENTWASPRVCFSWRGSPCKSTVPMAWEIYDRFSGGPNQKLTLKRPRRSNSVRVSGLCARGLHGRPGALANRETITSCGASFDPFDSKAWAKIGSTSVWAERWTGDSGHSLIGTPRSGGRSTFGFTISGTRSAKRFRRSSQKHKLGASHWGKAFSCVAFTWVAGLPPPGIEPLRFEAHKLYGSPAAAPLPSWRKPVVQPVKPRVEGPTMRRAYGVVL